MRLKVVYHGETPNASRQNTTAFRAGLYEAIRAAVEQPLVPPVVLEVVPLGEDRRCDTGLGNVFGSLGTVYDTLVAAGAVSDKRDIVEVVIYRWRCDGRNGIQLHLADGDEPF